MIEGLKQIHLKEDLLKLTAFDWIKVFHPFSLSDSLLYNTEEESLAHFFWHC